MGATALACAFFILTFATLASYRDALAAASNSPEPTATPTPASTPTRALPTTSPTYTPDEHFLLDRPVSNEAESNRPSWYYLYGDTQGGAYRVHHGVEFVNPLGTPLLAVADGTVVVAGNDAQPLCGDAQNVRCGLQTNFYGNLVVLRLDATYHDTPIYALYGHMNTLAVAEGERVRAGQTLGAVGATGIAEGPHVHFEVRLGINDYAHTRNPLLWFKPLPGYGILAGRVLDRAGEFVPC